MSIARSSAEYPSSPRAELVDGCSWLVQQPVSASSGAVGGHPCGREVNDGALGHETCAGGADLAGGDRPGGFEGGAEPLEVALVGQHVDPGDPSGGSSAWRTDEPVGPAAAMAAAIPPGVASWFASWPHPRSSTLPCSR